MVRTGGLTIEDLKNKVVCLNFDKASVMQSSLNGVVGLFKTKVNYDCIFILCVCHNLELAIGDAYKQDDWLKHCNEVLGSVFKLYYYSPKKYRALKVAAEVLDAKFVHFGGLQNVRCVASQQRAWSALRTNYVASVNHLQDMCIKNSDYESEAMGQALGVKRNISEANL